MLLEPEAGCPLKSHMLVPGQETAAIKLPPHYQKAQLAPSHPRPAARGGPRREERMKTDGRGSEERDDMKWLKKKDRKKERKDSSAMPTPFHSKTV